MCVSLSEIKFYPAKPARTIQGGVDRLNVTIINMNQRKAGIILSYINYGVNALIMLAYVPMLLHYVSKEQYGVYQMIGSFIGVMGVLDFGLSATVTRFVARERALNHPQQQQRIIQTALGLYLVLMGILILLGGGAYFLIGPLYGASLSAADLHTAQQIFLILLLNFAVWIPGNLFIALVRAYERFVLLQCLFLAGTIVSPLLIWGVLVWKASVVGVVWVQTIVNIGFIVSLFIYCKQQFHLCIKPIFNDKTLLKQLAGFSFFVFCGNVANQLYTRLGPLVLGVLVGALAVANYYIAAQLLMVFTVIPSLIGSVFLPKLSGEFVSQKNLELHNDIFCKTGRLQAMVALLILVGFVLLGKVFLVLWLGPGNEMCYRLAVVLMCGVVLNVVQSVAPSVLLAIDKYRFYAFCSLAMALLNMGLAYPLIRLYATMGCAVAYVLSVGIANGILLNMYYRKIGLNIRAFFHAVWPVVRAGIIAGVLLWALWQVWPVKNAWGSFILHGMCVVGVYAIMMAIWVFNSFEWDIVREMWQKIGQLVSPHQEKTRFER